uniref:Protein kinase domain-containing protein n=1 Tax=Amphimedon queenslandica TaxID=400682 RepID=A0A1X7TBH5_AMPQE
MNGQKRHKYLTDILPQADDISLDLLNKLLNFNRNKRLTAENCLEHPYLSKFHDSDKEPVIWYQIVPVIDDNVQLTAHEYREQLYKDIVLRHTELHPQSPKPASPAPPPNPDVLVEDCELESCISDHSLVQSERGKKEKKLKEVGGGYVSHSSPSLPAKKTSDDSEGGGGAEVKPRAFIPFMNRSKSAAVQARGGIMVRRGTVM